MIKQFLWALGSKDREISALKRELSSAKLVAKQLQDENNIKHAQLTSLEKRTGRAMQIMNAGVGDPEPTDSKARASYVAEASNFYEGILEAKLLQMTAQVRELLDTVYQDLPKGMDRTRFDDMLRGTSNAFKLLMDWGNQMKGEHLANTTNKGANE